jgi:aminoglycoside phosphotransferase family enzyme/predicted kinase
MAAALQTAKVSDLAARMLRPDFYPERPAKVELVETHISWVFLTDRFAYKLKKPVRFEFLDFSTPALRRQACEDEVRLNRRLAPTAYLGAVPVTADSWGHLQLDGEGKPVDWVVRMQRLPPDRTLQELICRGKLVEGNVQRLATMLADFYTQAPPLTMRPEEYRDELEHHVRANSDELSQSEHGLSPAMVQRSQSAQLRLLHVLPEMVDQRVCDGRIVEGHGDLRPEHIYLTRPPAIIDCIEFSYELRTLDVADELCFLAMECDRLAAPHVGQQIIDTYCRVSGDHPPPMLLDFYKCYRASVRAKVAALRSDQLAAAQRGAIERVEREYLGLADEYARRMGPPLVVVVRGLMGTGKSTLARALSKKLGLRLFHTDAIRRELFPLDCKEHAYGGGKYCAEHRQRVYDVLLNRGTEALNSGISVALDGTFLTSRSRAEAAERAQRAGAMLLLVECRCPGDVARQRIAERLRADKDLSEARPDLFVRQRCDEQGNPPGLESVIVDTTTSVNAQLDVVFGVMRLLLSN